MKDIQEETRTRKIRCNFTDYEINLIHRLLVDEEIRLEKKMPLLLAEFGRDFNKVKSYMKEVKKLRKLFTKIDDTEDCLGVFSRIEDYRLDKEIEI